MHPSSYTPPNGTLTPQKLHLRPIDLLSILTALLLLRLAFTPTDHLASNSTASIEFVFYHPVASSSTNANGTTTASPVPMDLDGDGVVDGLVMGVYLDEAGLRQEMEESRQMGKRAGSSSRKDEVSGNTNSGTDPADWRGGKWGLRILNLKPLHRRDDEIRDGLLSQLNGPFVPNTLFVSPLTSTSEQNNNPVYPLKMLPLHIPMQRITLGEEEKSRQRHKKDSSYGTNLGIPPKNEHNQEYDRTRHYFCGKDWHHAANSCHRHCPGGSSSDCGEGESCFADTPCDALLPPSDATKNTEETSTNITLTVRGTLPGISTLWSDGSVSLHVITADIVSTATDTTGRNEHRGKRERSKKKPELELRQLWRAFPLEKDVDSTAGTLEVKFDELGLAYESVALSSKDGDAETLGGDTIGSHGVILLGGRYSKSLNENPNISFHALDALTGATLWDLDGARGWSAKRSNGRTKEFNVPIVHTTSSARRRSHLPVKDSLDTELDNENSFADGDHVMTSAEECMSHFRHSVLNEANGALPHEFWEGDRGSMSLGRFERVKKSPIKKARAWSKRSQLNQKDGLIGRGRDSSLPRAGGGNQIGAMTGSSRGRGSGTLSWQTDFLNRAIPRRLINQQIYEANHPKTGKPNVVMFHGQDGLAVISLKNGRPVCHISLVDNALYADIDKDGVVDAIQVVTSSDDSHSTNIQSLMSKINKLEGREDIQVKAPDNKNDPVVCHALVTSGLPPKEEVFTAPLCSGGPTTIDHKMKLRAAPPLLVESSLGYGYDVVFAMNNGVLARFDSNGREVWRKNSAKDGTPTWHTNSVLLGRVQFGTVKSHSSVSASSHHNQHRPGSPVRPILISGEEGAAVISPVNGKVLSYVSYPQTAVAQPSLADLNGDGTDDFWVVSKDAVWGYCIVVETDRSGFFAIIVVTLVVAVALSALIRKTSRTS